MPCFVIATEHCQIGKTIDAVLCDIGPAGYPNRSTDVPIKTTIGEDTLLIDGESRDIISRVGENGVTTYLISSIALHNRERRIALAKASVLLDQLRNHLLALKDEGEDFTLVAEGLGQIYNFLHDERERLMAAPRSKNEGNGDA
jgi:hypothetical protein